VPKLGQGQSSSALTDHFFADREAALAEVLTQSGKAYRIAALRYKEGEIDLLDSLTIQQQAISAESSLLSIKHLQLEKRINLYLFLSGSR